ncbi:MAG: hypothetical protein KF901_19115 [Myxococcales bacterium]|nr:hypothetical protein [Myxococcales bacterium]
MPAGPDAILGAVYPSFAEVKAELDAEREARGIRRAERRRAQAEADARQAALHEAEDAAARIQVRAEPERAELRPATLPARGGSGRVTETRHVHDTTPPNPDAARIIVLRDRRPRKRGRGDPPD